jgi:hypothetical protein
MLKAGIQSVLSRTPGGERVNYQLQRASGAYTPARLRERVIDQARKIAPLLPYVRGKTIVEIGTGWELISPLLFFLHGAERIYTVDHLHHLRFDIVRLVVAQLDASGLDSNRLASLQACGSLDELLSVSRVCYMAPADATGLPNASADLFYTHEVLEHVPEVGLLPIVLESKRILRPGGVAYHAIEPGDHNVKNGSHVNHLRYSDSLWKLIGNNRIYSHNRLSAAYFLQLFTNAGASIISVTNRVEPSDLKLLRNGFPRAERFASVDPEELAVWYLEVLLRF